MTTILWTATGALLVLASIVAHEAMHAVGLARLGVHTPRAGLGFFRPRWKVATLRIKGRDTEVFVSPWLLGAWVSPDDSDDATDRIDRARWRDYAWFLGAGVWVQFVIAAGLLTLNQALRGHLLAAVVFAAVGCAVALATDLFTAYVIPVIWPAAILFAAWALFFPDPATSTSAADVWLVHDPVTMLGWAGSLVAVFALLNLLPFGPLDGGQLLNRLLRTWRVPLPVRSAVVWVGILAVVVMEGTAAVSLFS